MSHAFNVRVYGIYFNDAGDLLVSDEYIKGGYFTKFPGGGLEYGEGTRACLMREWQEEVHQDIRVGEHLYTTDYFQLSAFGDGRQIISIYYRVYPLSPLSIPLQDQPFAFEQLVDQAQAFRFIPRDALHEDSVTLPIDKTVVRLLLDSQ